ncbi:hypothetical protein M8818_002312 [Zalaria obscura]|uniref:Uncharacterized protein n=1 Tax=Zalaria obscura TaxID=2024903 RepID=A0ACC3SHF6_9PEZI
MESANRPSFSLPPINHLQPLDMDKVKQEQEYQQRKTATAGGNRSPRELLHPSQDAQRSSYLHPLPAGRSPPREAPRPEPPHSYPPPGPAPATHDRAPPSAMAPPQSFPYGYTPYPPQYAYPTPASSVYQPSVTQPAPGAPASAWKAEKPLPPPGASQAAYGDSVKRHLNFYDFEAALNDIAENSGVTLDFSRQYGARMHQMQRSGPLPGSMPAITEIDDLANKTRNTLEALSRMREVLLAEQQAAYYQQAQEQRYKAEDDAKHHDAASQQDDKAGGFAGAESKKRRGRAAPPGRCHSCNRAETPEWRRGPDGARTLCNACGLHYAKLTRKAGGNKAAIGSSNLRPKAGETSS